MSLYEKFVKDFVNVCVAGKCFRDVIALKTDEGFDF